MTYLLIYFSFCFICTLVVLIHTYVANNQKVRRIKCVNLSDMLVGFVLCFIPVTNIVLFFMSIKEICEVLDSMFSTIYPFEKKES